MDKLGRNITRPNNIIRSQYQLDGNLHVQVDKERKIILICTTGIDFSKKVVTK